MEPRSSPARGSSNDPAASSSVGEFAPRSIIEGIGDRDAGVGALPRVSGLAVGMIAPNEIPPARCKLIRRQRPSKTELGSDFGRCVRRIRRRFVRRRGSMPSELIRRLVRPLQSQIETRFSPGTRRGAKFEVPADARSTGGPRPVVISRPVSPPRLVEGALKLVISAVGHGARPGRAPHPAAARRSREGRLDDGAPSPSPPATTRFLP